MLRFSKLYFALLFIRRQLCTLLSHSYYLLSHFFATDLIILIIFGKEWTLSSEHCQVILHAPFSIILLRPPFEVQIVSSTPRFPLDQVSRPYKRSVQIIVFCVPNLTLLHVDVPQTDILSSWRSHNCQQLDNCDKANFIIMTESDGSRASSNLTVAVCDDEVCGTVCIAQLFFWII
jgi:hypothetical protein